ncbi:MAG: QueT transporter family protein [Clostridia bacterium]|nr:QueT transporter family protein [Clostridia bacterium]
MRKNNIKFIVLSALIAAVYAVSTYIAVLLNLAYGQIQFRFSEALNLLALFTPAAIPGLTVGCLIANIASPYGLVDMLLGSLATLLSALCIYFFARPLKKGAPYLAAFFPTLFNALIIGAEIAAFLPEGARWLGFLTSAWQVGLGEAAVCFLLGVPFYFLLRKIQLQNILK